jgi:GTP cyclohydrolase I
MMENKDNIDKKKIEKAVVMLLEAIGEDPDREGLKDTPNRVARMYEEIYGGRDENVAKHLSKTFTCDNHNMVIEKDITFYSTCEHHLMPFFGKAHIAYIPDGKVVGISKLARTVEEYAKRLQIQEQLTTQVADALMDNLSPKGVMVMIEAEHMCMSMRGVKKPGSKTVTFETRGEFKNNSELRENFIQCVVKPPALAVGI